MISEDAPGGLCPSCLMQFVAMSTGGADFQADDRSPPDLELVRAAFPLLQILELIGQGGMGAVFKARQTKLDRLVALKILPQRLAREPLFAERFEREGRLLARLNHPNIVGVHDFGQANGYYYLMMEYVDGVNLRQALTTGQFTTQQSLSVIPKICEALQYAHDQGVLHRDIKPENVLLDTKGRVKIADFGIAKFSGIDEKTGLTATGATIGTPHYMAPEQIERPADVDHRADIFSLGVVFYEMLTGELPLGRFAAPSERRESLDARIDQVVMRALEKDRERRQQSASEVRTQVEILSQNSTSLPPTTDESTTKSQVLATRAQVTRHTLRPKIAISLVVASIMLPAAMAIYLSLPGVRLPFTGPQSQPVWVFLALYAAWLGIPGTLFGLKHLQYLAKSGQRDGLLSAVVASTFWTFTIALLVFYLLAMTLLQVLHQGNSNTVEPLEVTIVLAVGLVATIWCVRLLHRRCQRTAPQTECATQASTSEPAGGLVASGIAGALWILFGMAIIWLTPVGTLERILIGLILVGLAVTAVWSIKGWIERTTPVAEPAEPPKHAIDKALQNLLKGFAVAVWVGLLLTTFYMMPRAEPTAMPTPANNLQGQNEQVNYKFLNMDIVSIATNENVLIIDVMDTNSTPQVDLISVEHVGEFGEGAVPQSEDDCETEFRIDFQGPKLLPEAVVSASEHYSGRCSFPGEPAETLTLDLNAGKTAPLAFAFPDAKAAQACKLRLERQVDAGQWPVALDIDGTKRLLFQANSAFGGYNVYVEPRR